MNPEEQSPSQEQQYAAPEQPVQPQGEQFAQPAPQDTQQTPPATPPAAPQQPVAPQQPGVPPQVATEDPGQVMGIISIILSFVGLALIGLILGIVARSKSKAAGYKGTLGTVGMILGIVFTVLGLLYIIFLIAVVAFGGVQDRAKESEMYSQTQNYDTTNQGESSSQYRFN